MRLTRTPRPRRQSGPAARRALGRPIAVGAAAALIAGVGVAAGPAAQAVVPDPVLHYGFDDLGAVGAPVPAATAIDDDAGGHDGSVVGSGATAATGPLGGSDRALNLPGGAAGSAAAYVTLPPGVLTATGDVTLSAWVRWAGGQTCAWAYALGASSSSYLFATPSCGGNVIGAVRSGGETRATGSGPLVSDGWSHVAVVLDSGVSVSTYVNGTQVASTPTTATGAAALGDAARSGFLGRSLFSADPIFAGAIDDVAVHAAALTTAEIRELGHDGYAAIVAADAAIGVDLGDTSGVTAALPLPANGEQGAEIAWASSDPDIVSETGAVNRPSAGSPDATVTLTPTYAMGDASVAGDPITVTVLAREPGDVPGLVAHYPLTDDYANSADGSTYGSAVPQGGATMVAGTGVTLDGVNDYVDLPDSLMAGLDEISVSMDVLLNPGQATPYFIWTLGVSSTGGYLFTTGDAHRAAITTGTYSGEQVTTKGSALARGRWVTITYTQDATGTATLYEDGVQVARRTGVTITPGDIGNGVTPNDFIGRSQYSGDRYLSGQVRDFRVYDEALQPSDLEYARLNGLVNSIDLGRTTGLSQDLDLPASVGGVDVAWTTSDPSVITADGEVTLTDEPGTARLTATLTRNGVTVTREFRITTIGLAGILDHYQTALTIDPVVRSGTALPTFPEGVTGTYAVTGAGATITDGNVLSTTGSQAADVIVTATVATGGAQIEKVFAVTVLPAAAAYDLLGYTRTALGTQTYGPAVANNLHLALRATGGEFAALHDNTAVLFTQGLRTADYLMATTTMRDPFVFHRGDGGYGVLAVVGDGGGAPLASYAGRLLYVESDDLRTFTEVGYVTVDDAAVIGPRASWDSANDRYVLSWTDGADQWHTATVDSLRSAATGGTGPSAPVSGAPVGDTAAPTTAITGARPVNDIVIDAATARGLQTRFGRIVNTTSEVADMVTTSAGGEVDLSSVTADLGYSDGSHVQYPIDWDADSIAAVDTDTPGDYTVTGTLADQRNIYPIAPQRADPTAIHYQGKYYFVSTWDVNNTASAGLPLRVADTIAGLATAPEIRIIDNTDTATDGSRLAGCFWAPDIVEVDGQLQIFVAPCYGSASWNRVEATVIKLKPGGDPAVPDDWTQPQKVLKADGSPLQLDAAHPGISLDMTYYHDEVSGTDYAVWSQRYINSPHPGGTGSGNGDAELWIAEYDAEAVRLVTEPVLLNRAGAGWEQNTADVVEGAFFAVRDGRIWLTYSGSGVDATYAVGMMTAAEGADLLDPDSWTEWSAPVVKSNPDTNEFGPGHSGFFADENDDLYFIYHAKQGTGGSRDAGIRKVFWAADGQPILDMTDDERIRPEHRQVSLTVRVVAAEQLDVSLTASGRCVAGKVVIAVRATNADSVPAAFAISTPYGAKSVTVGAGRASSVTFSTRQASVAAQDLTATVTATRDGTPLTRALTATTEAVSCP